MSYGPRDLDRAARAGDLQAVQEILGSGDVSDPELALIGLSQDGNVIGVKILLEAGCPMDSDTFDYVANNLYYDQYIRLHDKQSRQLSPVLDCLKILVDAGCPVDVEESSKAVFNTVCLAAKWGHIDCLKTLIHTIGRSNCSFNSVEFGVTVAANSECLKLLIGSGFPMTVYAIENAIEHNDAESLQLLIEAKCPMNDADSDQRLQVDEKYLVELAASTGSVECLKLLLNAGCPISETAFTVATNRCEIDPVTEIYWDEPDFEMRDMFSRKGHQYQHFDDGKWAYHMRKNDVQDLKLSWSRSSRHQGVKVNRQRIDDDQHGANYVDDDADTKRNKVECLKLLIATGQFDHQKGFIGELFNGDRSCHDVLTQAGFPWNRRLRIKSSLWMAPDDNDWADDSEPVQPNDILMYAGDWSDEELNSAFARKWIWTAEDLDNNWILQQRVDALKAKKAEMDRVAIESCTILPVEVVKHVLCSYF